MNITCLYRKNWNGKIKRKDFNSYEIFGRWIADNAVEISIIDVVKKQY